MGFCSLFGILLYFVGYLANRIRWGKESEDIEVDKKKGDNKKAAAERRPKGKRKYY